MKRSHIVVAGCMILLLGAGCSSSYATPSTTATPTGVAARACQAIAAVQAPLTKLATVGTTTTVGEVRGLQQQLSTALTTLGQRLSGRNIPAFSDLTTDNSQLASTLQGLPDSAPLSQAAPNLVEVQTKVTQAQTATIKVAAVLQCAPLP